MSRRAFVQHQRDNLELGMDLRVVHRDIHYRLQPPRPRRVPHCGYVACIRLRLERSRRNVANYRRHQRLDLCGSGPICRQQIIAVAEIKAGPGASVFEKLIQRSLEAGPCNLSSVVWSSASRSRSASGLKSGQRSGESLALSSSATIKARSRSAGSPGRRRSRRERNQAQERSGIIPKVPHTFYDTQQCQSCAPGSRGNGVAGDGRRRVGTATTVWYALRLTRAAVGKLCQVKFIHRKDDHGREPRLSRAGKRVIWK